MLAIMKVKVQQGAPKGPKIQIIEYKLSIPKDCSQKKKKEKAEKEKIKGGIQWASSPYGVASTFTTPTFKLTAPDTFTVVAP